MPPKVTPNSKEIKVVSTMLSHENHKYEYIQYGVHIHMPGCQHLQKNTQKSKGNKIHIMTGYHVYLTYGRNVYPSPKIMMHDPHEQYQ